MEHVLTEALTDALSKKMVEQITDGLRAYWSIVAEEMASTRKSNEQLSRQIEAISTAYVDQAAKTEEKLEEAAQELRRNRENSVKMAQILDETMKNLGLEE